jgi:hypothetical protein
MSLNGVSSFKVQVMLSCMICSLICQHIHHSRTEYLCAETSTFTSHPECETVEIALTCSS